jgi:hypothetical protein
MVIAIIGDLEGKTDKTIFMGLIIGNPVSSYSMTLAKNPD